MENTQKRQANSKKNGVDTYTLASLHRPATKRIADLEWRIKFTQMKLNLWHNLDNGDWTQLKTMHETAVKELKLLSERLG